MQTFFVGCHIVHVLDSFTREKSFVQKSASTRFITGREDFIRSSISLLFSTQCIAFKASLQQLPHLEYCPETPGQPLRDISHCQMYNFLIECSINYGVNQIILKSQHRSIFKINWFFPQSSVAQMAQEALLQIRTLLPNIIYDHT